jgi:HEAT repeat protein
MQDKIEKIISMCRQEDSRWEGLVLLRSLKEKTTYKLIWPYAKDEDWMIRCTVIDKIGDLRQAKYTQKLLPFLLDEDATVRRSAQEAIKQLTKEDCSPLFKELKNPERLIREFCAVVIRSRVHTHLTQIILGFSTETWVPANRLLYIVWVSLKSSSESILIEALSVKHTQRHAIMMLAILQSRRAIPHFVSLYEVSSLRRHIIQAIMEMANASVFSNLIDYITVNGAEESVKRMILKIGSPILPYLLEKLKDPQLSPLLLPLLNDFTLDPVAWKQIEANVQDNALLDKYLQLKRLGFRN